MGMNDHRRDLVQGGAADLGSVLRHFQETAVTG